MAANIEGVGKVTSFRRALDKLENVGRRIKRAKEERQEQVELAVGVAAVVAGGAAVGALRSYYGKGEKGEVNVPGTDIDADAVAALLLVGAGVTGLAGKQSHAVAMFGAGMSAGIAAFEAKRIFDERQRAA